MKNSIKNNNGEIEHQKNLENDLNKTDKNFTLEPKSNPEITDSALVVRGKGKCKDDRRKKVMKHLNKHLNKQSA